MNKKISTLLASALLVSSASAYAVEADVVAKLEKGYYVLNEGTAIAVPTAVGSHFQVNADGKLEVVAAAGFTAGKYNQGLWTITASAENSNHFAFTNKVNGLSIAFDPKTAVAADASGAVTAPETGSELTGESMAWAWVANSDDAATLGQAMKLSFAFSTDSTMALAKATDGTVFAYKYANAKPATGVTPLTIQATKPGSVIMKAADLNVLTDATLGKYFTLTPNKKNLQVDAITNVKFFATDGVTDYVTLKELGTEKYLRVDTAVHAATGLNTNNLYQLARKALKEGEVVGTSVPNNFKIEKDLFKDNAFISIAAANSRFTFDKDAVDSKWATPLATTATPYDYTVLSSILLTPTTEVMTLYSQNAPAALKENLLFSVSEPSQAKDNKTSVEDGLYYIKNDKGQYLASPIYNNGNSSEWVTVNEDEQNVAHMPAYQWVILKKNTYEYAAPKSPVTLANREFAKLGGLKQLYKANGAKYYSYGNGDSLQFVRIEDKAILGDSLLGYKNFSETELQVNRYMFNYFNPYVSDKYIGKSSKDSLLVVKDTKTAFALEAQSDLLSYGYTVDATNSNRIPGLKQLYRQVYTVFVNTADGAYSVGVNDQKQFALNKRAAVPFFFKENNDVQRTVDDKKNDFYSLLFVSLIDGAWSIGTKAGVADETQDAILKNQTISEVRTSSFMITPFDAPLYRRFNSEKLEGNVGDAPDTLRFKDKYRGEYLQVEANPNFTVKGIDFLGIYTPDFTKDGKSFIVDTAFVNRFNGALKPQYLISIDREDIPATPGEPCHENGNHFNFDANGNKYNTTAENCYHATPAKPSIQYGKYLVNFGDSVKNAVNANDYKWKGYTRAGFVKAVHLGDSLYILTGQFANVTNKTFDAAAIIKAVADKKYDAANIINLIDTRNDNGESNLDADRHKMATWSMRFADPEKAGNEVEEDRAFLIESQKAEKKNYDLLTIDDIAPSKGQWLKMQNGCIVLSGSNGSESSFTAITGDDDALIFNVEKGSKEDFATDNDAITTSTFSVIAKQGAVQVIGAAGKKVVISNILGQAIANTVITSDDAIIAAPAGVVVVAVEGEAAVKAIVK